MDSRRDGVTRSGRTSGVLTGTHTPGCDSRSCSRGRFKGFGAPDAGVSQAPQDPESLTCIALGWGVTTWGQANFLPRKS